MPPTSNLVTDNLPGLLLLILIIAVPLAFLGSIILLRLYRRAVIHVMRARANPGLAESVSTEASVPHQEPLKTMLNIIVLDSGSGRTAAPAAESLYAALLRAPWRAAAIYAVAGICYALAMSIIFLAATGSGFDPFRFLIPFWYYAWPVAVTVCLIAAATWRTRLIVVAAYFLALIPLGAIARLGISGFNWGQIALLWLLTNFLAAVVLLAFLNRRLRAVGPLVLTFMIVAVTGSVLLPFLAGGDTRLSGFVLIFGETASLNRNSIFFILVFTGLLLFSILGWLMLGWIGHWYKQKKISEQSITIDAIWLLFGIFQSIGLFFEGERWFVASLLSFVVYKIVSWVGFLWLGRTPVSKRNSLNLLLLRVFALGGRSERLFDVLAMHWRYIGSIRLIAGPDLVTTTMEPHEFLDFLSGKLARRYIDNAQTLELRLSEMDLKPDFDGQFRVNDFFCYDDTWRMVLSRLVEESDVLLMDLRGFSSQNTGVIFEINELIDLVPLERIVFIIDDTTDESFLRQVLQQAWKRMKPSSPNRRSTPGVLHLFRVRKIGNRELQQFLNALSSAASAAR
ncbi:MAG TPA: hypothetical protein VJ821_16155 [Anaerolineales bacterium]|nr:hypothetical protein [Anaerolineales bacterium]